MRKGTIIIAVIAIVGLIVSVHFTFNDDPRISGLSQNLFIGLVLLVFTPYFTRYLIEQRGWERWKTIENRVMEEINYELRQILTDISNVSNFDHALSFDHDASTEEIIKASDRSIMEQVKKFAKNKNLQVNHRAKNHLLKGDYGTLFAKRSEFIEKIITKYLDYIDAEVIMKLTDIQKSLHRIDQEIIIRNKYIGNDWIRLETDSDVLKRLRENMQEIISSLHFLSEKEILKFD